AGAGKWGWVPCAPGRSAGIFPGRPPKPSATGGGEGAVGKGEPMMDQPDNRRRFLARLSERLGKSRRESAPPPEGETREEKLTEEERISRFLHNLSLLGGRGGRIRGREELTRRLMEEGEGEQASPLMCWKAAFLEEITDDLSNVERIPWESGRDAAELIRDAERAKAGLVRADWGVASTGSIALIGGQGR